MILVNFFYWTGIIVWGLFIIVLVIFIFARRNALKHESNIDHIFEDKGAQKRSKAPLREDLTLSRYMDALKEAAEMEFNEVELSMHDFQDIDDVIY